MSKLINDLMIKSATIEAIVVKDLKRGLLLYKEWGDEVKIYLDSEGYSQSEKNQIASVLNIQENPFSLESTKAEILNAINRVNQIINTLSKSSLSKLDKRSATLVVESILRNFYKYIEEMFRKTPHGNGTLKLIDLDKIQIGNEYDVQRMLYALLKPIFPCARMEVPLDTGHKIVRFDIIIDEYDLVIEVKCTRAGLNERELIKQMADDVLHYNVSEIFFFIFDKASVISNVDSFERQYNRMYGESNIKTIVGRVIRY